MSCGVVTRQTYCHKVRKIHSSGAIVVLIWVFLAWTSFIFLGGSAASTGVHFVGNGLLNRQGIDLTLLGKEMSVHYVCYVSVAVVWVLGTPLAGWLADVNFGRYKVMQISLWLMWSGLVIHSFLYLNANQQPMNNNNALQSFKSVVSFSTLTVYMFGAVGFLINSVQFGIDQMPHASSAELSTFIRWYTFATCAGIWFPQAVLGLIGTCPTVSYPKETLSIRQSIVLALLPPLLLSLALLLDSYLRHHLIIEPQSKNPFKLLAGVLKYVARHNRPTNPSAYVYTLQTIPNRFDFAKTQFGGPYTTEEVEDVRTLLRIVVLMSPVFLILSSIMLTAINVSEFETDIRMCSDISECSQTLINYFGYNYWFVAMVIIVANEFLVPMMYNRFDGLCCKMLRRIMIGSLLVLTLSLVFVGLGMTGYARPYITCSVIVNTTSCDLNISYLPVVIPINFTLAIPTILFISGAWEFICAQAPYSMRGLLIGAVWATETIGAATAYIIKISWYFGSKRHMTVASGHVGCGGFYFLSVFFICLLGLVLYCVAVCWYRPRMREETEDQQLLVEEIYAKEIDASINSVSIVCRDM